MLEIDNSIIGSRRLPEIEFSIERQEGNYWIGIGGYSGDPYCDAPPSIYGCLTLRSSTGEEQLEWVESTVGLSHFLSQLNAKLAEYSLSAIELSSQEIYQLKLRQPLWAEEEPIDIATIETLAIGVSNQIQENETAAMREYGEIPAAYQEHHQWLRECIANVQQMLNILPQERFEDAMRKVFYDSEAWVGLSDEEVLFEVHRALRWEQMCLRLAKDFEK